MGNNLPRRNTFVCFNSNHVANVEIINKINKFVDYLYEAELAKMEAARYNLGEKPTET
jgi:hypothetical protein